MSQRRWEERVTEERERKEDRSVGDNFSIRVTGEKKKWEVRTGDKIEERIKVLTEGNAVKMEKKD